jgi:amino acid permease
MSFIVYLIIVLLSNIPFGYWRGNVRRFTLQWFIAIHFPVLFIISLRYFNEIGYDFYTFLFSISAYVAGQSLGYKIFTYRKKSGNKPLTSCLVMDLVRININDRA